KMARSSGERKINPSEENPDLKKSKGKVPMSAKEEKWSRIKESLCEIKQHVSPEADITIQ
ncbi:hypothetical protein ACLOJK_004699, partial [Asimina triloba]